MPRVGHGIGVTGVCATGVLLWRMRGTGVCLVSGVWCVSTVCGVTGVCPALVCPALVCLVCPGVCPALVCPAGWTGVGDSRGYLFGYGTNQRRAAGSRRCVG